MKKRILAAAMSVAMLLSLTGCSSELSDEYITVKKYKGLEVTEVTKEEVTDETVETTINDKLSAAATTEEITDRAAELGDTVVMDYVGTVDDVAFDGGTATDASLVLGSGSYIGANGDYEGFEDQIVGHKVGEEFDITVMFPEDYSEEMGGKVADFHITLKSITQTIVPELTDEWVAENSEESETVDEYREEIRASLEEDAENVQTATLQEAVAAALVEQVEVTTLPEDMVTAQYDEIVKYYETYAAMYGAELTDFITNYMGMTEEDFEASAQESAENYVVTILAMELIAEKEGIEITEEDISELAAVYGYDDNEAFIEQYGEDVVNQSILFDKVTLFLVDECVQVEAEE